MRKTMLLSLALASLALPLAAQASEPAGDLSYTYVEGGYQHINSAIDADGAYVRGSYEFGDSGFYLQGGYSNLSSDFDIDPETTEIGLGYHHSFTPRVDGLAELAYQHVDTRFGNADGYRVSAGVRAQMGQNWEGLAKINHYDGSDFSSETSATLGAQYRFTQTWGVTGEVEFIDGDESYLLGVRATF